MDLAFVPYSEIVPAEVAWFWKAVEVGRVPYLYADPAEAAYGVYDADPEETPFILCPDWPERIGWTVSLLETARVVPPTA